MHRCRPFGVYVLHSGGKCAMYDEPGEALQMLYCTMANNVARCANVSAITAEHLTDKYAAFALLVRRDAVLEQPISANLQACVADLNSLFELAMVQGMGELLFQQQQLGQTVRARLAERDVPGERYVTCGDQTCVQRPFLLGPLITLVSLTIKPPDAWPATVRARLDRGAPHPERAGPPMLLRRLAATLIGEDRQRVVTSIVASLEQHGGAVVWGGPGEGKSCVSLEAACLLWEASKCQGGALHLDLAGGASPCDSVGC